MLFLKFKPSKREIPSYNISVNESSCENAPSILDNILSYCEEEGYIDAEILKDFLFPCIPHQVFISHSRDDLQLARALKFSLNSDGISAFIDSDVWENVYDVLHQYQFPHEESIIPAETANEKSKHLFLMLAGALTKVISRASCFVYIEPLNILSSNASIVKSESPWLAHELATAELLSNQQLIKEAMMNASSLTDIPIVYDISASFIPKMNTLNNINDVAKRIVSHVKQA